MVLPLGATRRLPGERTPVHAGTVGLMLVILALTIFSIAAAVRDAGVAARAQHSAELSAASERAERVLAYEEEVVDQLVEDPGPGSRAEYDDTRADMDRALTELADVGDATVREQVRGWTRLHEQYGAEAERLLRLAARDPAAAEDYETQRVDPPYDRLMAELAAEVDHHTDQASQALSRLNRSQRASLVVTPLVFTLGLALLTFFSVVLSRSRRLLIAQAEENSHQASHDALTGLPNRTLLRSRGEIALDAARAAGSAVTLFVIDLDRFKQINDTLGHHYGDLVLRALAARLHDALSPMGTVARLGGDEFAVLLPHVADLQDALRVAAELLVVVQVSTDVDGVTLDVDASVGVVMSGRHGDDIETLLQHADIAMYRAKEQGLGVCVFDPELNSHSAEQLGLLGELRRAIDNRELVLHYQRKTRLDDGRLCGVEALLRWQHPERGIVPPAQFIPAAENTALIRPLTLYVLDAALAQAREWLDEGRPVRVAVNVSARNLLHDSFLQDVQETLDRWGVPATYLELEVTESTIMADPERAQTVRTRLAALGITLSIDDFGAGYTCMAHLSTLPVHQLKIDRSLVSRIDVDAGDALIVRSLIDLGHSLGLRVVAEGVEDASTAAELRRLGCDVAQGYLFGRPEPAAALNSPSRAALPLQAP